MLVRLEFFATASHTKNEHSQQVKDIYEMHSINHRVHANGKLTEHAYHGYGQNI